jgi:hypothetical protein
MLVRILHTFFALGEVNTYIISLLPSFKTRAAALAAERAWLTQEKGL